MKVQQYGKINHIRRMKTVRRTTGCVSQTQPAAKLGTTISLPWGTIKRLNDSELVEWGHRVITDASVPGVARRRYVSPSCDGLRSP